MKRLAIVVEIGFLFRNLKKITENMLKIHSLENGGQKAQQRNDPQHPKFKVFLTIITDCDFYYTYIEISEAL